MSRGTRSTVDQIEFLPPNDAAFGAAGGADFVGFDGADDEMFGDDEPRSRWLPAVASVVVLGLLAVGIIVAAPWDENATATPPTTTTPATTTTVPATVPPTIRPPVELPPTGPPGFVLDQAGELRLAGAWSSGAGARPDSAYADDRFDLWATPDATRTTGRWLAVATQHSRGESETTWPDAARLTIGTHGAIIRTDATGVSRMSFTAADETAFEIGGFGFSLDELVAVANEVHAGADRRTVYYGTLIDGPLAGMTEIATQLVQFGGLDAYSLMAQAQSSSYYSSATAHSFASVELRVSEPTDINDAVLQFLMQPVTDLTAQDLATLTSLCLDHECRGPVHISQDPYSVDSVLVTWADERGTVTVSSYGLPVSTIVGLLPQVRLTDQTEWTDLVVRSNEGTLDGPPPQSFPSAEPTTIGEHADGSNTPRWSAQMTADGPVAVYVNSNISGWGGLIADLGVAPAVRHYAAPSITYVIGTAQFPSAARTMRVTVQGLPPVDVPMVQVGDTTTFAAAYAYIELLSDTVEFLDLSGAVVTE